MDSVRRTAEVRIATSPMPTFIGKRRATARRVSKVEIRQLPPGVWETALRLAGNDVHRLRIDGAAVYVANERHELSADE